MELFTETATWKTEEHGLIAETARKIFADHLTPKMPAYIKQGYIDREFWKLAGQQGLMGGSIPTEYGGSGGNIGFDAIVLYELAASGNASWTYIVQSIVMHYIIAYGTEAQKQRWIPGLVSGESVAAIAMTEPGCGSDLQSIRSRLVRKGDNYQLNGTKTFITHGTTTDLVIVAAKTDSNERSKDISLIVLETNGATGLHRSQKFEKLGLMGSDTCELSFEDVMIPRENLLGQREGTGFYQMMTQLPWERLALGVVALGSIDYTLAQTIEYVRSRQAFGQRLMDFQNTRFKLAELKTKAEMLRAFVNDCIVKADMGILDTAAASMAKYWGTETQNLVAHECLQLHGGYGYMMETPVARQYADARVQMIYGGANEVMKELICKSIDL
ncbi:acyl-CoA dehydrogenase [Sneathiella chungangensis]|uniref:Acyl-CoA dehydrogenase n=1 Tax=Sneathiella chungangensis TaxID=1418234 RepID=A0A845MIV4_9PROT|nr:acyl-CoA dehydrogenase family protein [Sneathiella chungangensis]MZR23227.1 acyl-CoA dehydrogenase [Sneathiella chungangensis]